MEPIPTGSPPAACYCGVCGIMYATRDDNPKFAEKLATVYNLPVEEIHCADAWRKAKRWLPTAGSAR